MAKHRIAPGRPDVLTLKWRLWREEWEAITPTGIEFGPFKVVRHMGEEWYQIPNFNLYLRAGGAS